VKKKAMPSPLSSLPGSAFRLIPEIIQPRLERKLDSPEPGRPEKALLALRAEEYIGDDLLFGEFSKREPLWGFGDLQVKRLLKRLPN
jgi:hypothetical protein